MEELLHGDHERWNRTVQLLAAALDLLPGLVAYGVSLGVGHALASAFPAEGSGPAPMERPTREELLAALPQYQLDDGEE